MSKINFPIIFTHVPRSGGITLNSIFKAHFLKYKYFDFYVNESQGNVEKSMKEFEVLSPQQKKKLIFLTGHINWGIHEYYTNQCTYITLFRNPVTRIISYYNYVLKNSSHFLHNTIIQNNIKLKNLLEANISIEFDNMQVRQISGIKNIKCGNCEAYMLEKAIDNLDKYYPVFGINEMFDHSLLLFKKYFGFTEPFYRILNYSKVKEVKVISDEIVEIIKKTNYLDIKFYEYAKNKFDQIISNYDGIDYEVIDFQRKNNFIKEIRIGDFYYGLLYHRLLSGISYIIDNRTKKNA